MFVTHRGARLALLLGASALALIAAPAMAQTAPPFAQLLAQARGTAPRLAEAEANVAQAEGLAAQASVRPNPVAALEIENFAGSGPYDGLGLAETTASIEQTFELGGKRPARVAAARAGVASAQARGALAQTDYAAQLAVAYAEAEAAVAKSLLTEELLSAAEVDARTARELVDAGREAELRALQAAAERDAARAERDEARANQQSAFARLSAIAGANVHYDSVADSLLNRPAVPFAAIEAKTPAVTAARAERDAAAARVRAERVRVTPDVTLSAGARRFSGEDATAFVAGVSVPLPIFDRNRGAIQAAQGELAAAEARLRQAELEAESDMRTVQAQARSAASRLEAAGGGEAAAAEAYRLARLGYESGRLPLLELTSARRALAAARVRTLDAKLARVRAEAEIARLTGRAPFGG